MSQSPIKGVIATVSGVIMSVVDSQEWDFR